MDVRRDGNTTRTAAVVYLPEQKALGSDPQKRWFVTEPQTPIQVLESAILIAAVSFAALCGLGCAVWLSDHVSVDPTAHLVGLFVHLSCVALGFGAVLAADYNLFLWLIGRCSLSDAVRSAERVGVPIWTGLVGLVLSGIVLDPNLDSILTQVKIGAIAILTVNGIQAMVLGRRMGAVGSGELPLRLMMRGAMTATVSQVCWWAAVGVGFWNSNH